MDSRALLQSLASSCVPVYFSSYISVNINVLWFYFLNSPLRTYIEFSRYNFKDLFRQIFYLPVKFSCTVYLYLQSMFPAKFHMIVWNELFFMVIRSKSRENFPTDTVLLLYIVVITLHCCYYSTLLLLLYIAVITLHCRYTLHCYYYSTLLLLFYIVVITLYCCYYSTFLLLLYIAVITLHCCCYSTLLLLLYIVVITLHCYYYSTFLLLFYTVVITLHFCYYSILLLLLYIVVITLHCCY
jgi:hypothetical protein